MSTTIKILLAVAAVLIISGLILFTLLMMSNEWDFSKLSTEKYETNTYDIVDSFENIQIDTDTANITFALSDDAKSKVVCYEREKVYHSVSVSNGTIFIRHIATCTACVCFYIIGFKIRIMALAAIIVRR